MKLYFNGGKTSEIKITKEGKKYLYFTANSNGVKYRMIKETGEIQISPYWNIGKNMYLK